MDLNSIVDAVNKELKIDLRDKCRKKAYLKAREILSYILAFEQQHNFREVAKAIGIDRTTIYTYVQNVHVDKRGIWKKDYEYMSEIVNNILKQEEI